MRDNSMLVTTFHGAFPFILYAFFCIFAFFFVWKYVPETKNKTLEEMTMLWDQELKIELASVKK
jgi:hypothetical protein